MVALGASDLDDRTLEEIESICSNKIRIIHTVWDLEKYPRGMELLTRPILPGRPITSHAWYANEIRITRNHPDIHSWESAQSFRRIPDFDGIHYRQKQGTYKLKVARVDAYIYHYGWVQPPHFMQSKRKAMEVIHRGQQQVDVRFSREKEKFDYGDLSLLTVFKGTHPAIMWERMRLFNWADQLNYGRKLANRPKHERMKYRILTFIE